MMFLPLVYQGIVVDTSEIIWISVTALLSIAAILVVWRLVYRWIGTLSRKIDQIVPGDLSALSGPMSRLVVTIISAAILGGAGLAIADQLGVDVGGAVDLLEGWGQSILDWAMPHLFRILLILGIAFLVIRVLQRLIPSAIRRYLTQRVSGGTEAEEIDKRANTLNSVIKQGITWIIVVTTLFVVLSELGVNITPILAGAGVAGIAIGLGAQSLVRDILAGIFILLEDQYRVGDVVTIAGIGGLVEDINLRRTILRDLNYTMHVIPNGEVRTASNMTKDKSRVNINISVAYKEDLDKVMDLLTKVGKDMLEDPYFGPLFIDPIKALRVDSFGDSAIEIKVLGEVKPIRQWEVGGEYRKRVKKAFDEAGIEIPFPHRTLYWGQNVETILRNMPNDRTKTATDNSDVDMPDAP